MFLLVQNGFACSGTGECTVAHFYHVYTIPVGIPGIPGWTSKIFMMTFLAAAVHHGAACAIILNITSFTYYVPVGKLINTQSTNCDNKLCSIF
jgi:hypothetical protein